MTGKGIYLDWKIIESHWTSLKNKSIVMRGKMSNRMRIRLYDLTRRVDYAAMK